MKINDNLFVHLTTKVPYLKALVCVLCRSQVPYWTFRCHIFTSWKLAPTQFRMRHPPLPVCARSCTEWPSWSVWLNFTTTTGWQPGVVVSALALINEVNQRRARLVLRWMTVCGFKNRTRTFISVCNQPATQGQLSRPSLRGQ